jgi:hypothetical protein
VDKKIIFLIEFSDAIRIMIGEFIMSNKLGETIKKLVKEQIRGIKFDFYGEEVQVVVNYNKGSVYIKYRNDVIAFHIKNKILQLNGNNMDIHYLNVPTIAIFAELVVPSLFN